MRRAFACSALTVAAAVCVAMEPAAAACPVAEIIAPERGARVGQPRPAIEWRALPGVSRYRVQLESRVPEGRVLSSTDSVVEGTRFIPPADLAESRAAVKLLVTAACENGPSTVREQPARFFVDLTLKCPPISRLSFEDAATGLAGGAGRVAWARPAAATRYEITFYAMPDGKVITTGETASTSYDTPRNPAPMMVAIRPRCGTAVGPAVYGFVPAAR